MAKLNNESFHLLDYSFDSSVGNYGIKLSGQNRNIVLDLGREIATVTLSAALENPTDYANLKKEFNEAELSTLELDSSTKYLAYPDKIAIRRQARDPLLGDYTDWRVAEMSFLIPDTVIYGDENSTTFNITQNSALTGTLKNISISGAEDTPLSISFESYNLTSDSTAGTGGGTYIEFGEPDYVWYPSSTNMKIYKATCEAGELDNPFGYSHCPRRIPDFLPPVYANNTHGWQEISVGTTLDDYDELNRVNLSEHMFDGYFFQDKTLTGWDRDYCHMRYNIFLKFDFLCNDSGVLKFMSDGKGMYIPPGQDGVSESNPRLYIRQNTSWIEKTLTEIPGRIYESEDISIASSNISNNYVTMMYAMACIHDRTESNPASCPSDAIDSAYATMSFARITRLRRPKVIVRYPITTMDYITGIVLNGTNYQTNITEDVSVKVYGCLEDSTLKTLLDSATVVDSAWGLNTHVSLFANCSAYDYACIEIASDKVTDYDGATGNNTALFYNASQPLLGVAIHSDVSTANYKQVHMWQPFEHLDKDLYGSGTGGLKNLEYYSALSKFEVWNHEVEDTKFSISGFLLGKYEAKYLENLKYEFTDNFNETYPISQTDANLTNGRLWINQSGYVLYKLGFGIPLIENPKLYNP